jgi:hypothetical protein
VKHALETFLPSADLKQGSDVRVFGGHQVVARAPRQLPVQITLNENGHG